MFCDSKMYDLLNRQLAYQVQQHALEASDPQYDSDILACLTEGFERHHWLKLTTSLARPIEKSPFEVAIRSPCSYHAHEKTEPCDASTVEEFKIAIGSSHEENITTDENTEGEKAKDTKRTKEEKPRSPFETKEEIRQYIDKLPNQPRNKDKPYSLQNSKHDKQKQPPRGKAKHLANWRTAADYDSSKTGSSSSSVKGKTNLIIPSEGCRGPGRDDDESHSARTGILTPTSSTTSTISPGACEPTFRPWSRPAPRSNLQVPAVRPRPLRGSSGLAAYRRAAYTPTPKHDSQRELPNPNVSGVVVSESEPPQHDPRDWW